MRLLRPYQWTKNAFVFVPMFFGGGLLDGRALASSLVTFAGFSLVASSVYCLNDIMDLEEDRRHSGKRSRPLASGEVGVGTAWALMALALALGFSLLPLLGDRAWRVGAVLLAYCAMNVLYCAFLKRFAIVDVCVVALGFVLRVVSGGCATDIAPSHWLVLMTFLLTLFLSLAKRRDDVLSMESTGRAPRRSTHGYNLEFINQAITVTASVTMVCYVMYTVSPEVEARLGSDKLYLTSVFVLAALLRYMQLVVLEGKGGDPTRVMLQDRFIQVVVLLWALGFLALIYFW